MESEFLWWRVVFEVQKPLECKCTHHGSVLVLFVSMFTSLRLRARRAVGVARQFVQPHFSRTESKLVKSNLLDTKQGGYSQHAD